MKIKDLQKPLDISDVDFRVQSISAKWYAILLAYKNARVDMNRLDEVVWPLNWKKSYTRENKNCIVSIYDTEKKEWISKEDTGTESFSEAEKWLASDSFKRACFNWGIGRELYDYPFIIIKLNEDEFKVEGRKAKPTYNFKLKEWAWSLNITSDGKVLWLFAKDQNDKLRFKFWKPIK